MACRATILAVIVIGGCKSDPVVIAPTAPVAAPVIVEPKLACEAVAFADSTPVPEASGAAWMELAGKPMLVVTSDSGNQGAYGIVDPETGATVESGRWPLGAGNDDVEGLAVRGGKLYGLASNGFMRVWARAGAGWDLVDGPYPIGRGDLVCDQGDSNCAKNYEGLCLAAKPSPGPDACLGFAASKEDGHLYCLVADGARVAIRADRAIPVSPAGALADCAFDDTDRLWVGSNIFELNAVSRIDGWRDPATAIVAPIGSYGVGFSEVIAVKGDVLYRMSDTGGAPSSMAKFRCSAVER